MSNQLTYAVVIPARYKSSRFPGKPLVDLKGKPMIQWVWELCCKAVGPDLVYVATDDDRIEHACVTFGAQVIRTSESCKTGTDRLAEANNTLKKDFLINVQGDEPILNPDDICKVRDAYLQLTGTVVNSMCAISSETEFRSFNVPKVVVSESSSLLYMSRAAIPTSKTSEFKGAMKQVCIYAFGAEHLKLFASCAEKTPNEEIEDIEILRFLDKGVPVHMIEVASGSAAVDTPEDVEKVLALM